MRAANISRHARRHVEEARRNYSRYTAHVCDDPDLAVTELFWSALHLVQAHAVHAAARPPFPDIPRTHADRNEYVRLRMGRITRQYLKLQLASEDARYDLVQRSVAAIEAMHDDWFAPIRQYCEESGLGWEDQSP